MDPSKLQTIVIVPSPLCGGSSVCPSSCYAAGNYALIRLCIKLTGAVLVNYLQAAFNTWKAGEKGLTCTGPFYLGSAYLLC